MALDMKKIGSLIQAGNDLVIKIKSSAISIDDAANAVEQTRQGLAAAATFDANGNLTVGFADKDAQKAIMAKIVELQESIVNLAGDPIVVAGLQVELSNQFLNLANTQNAMINAIITIPPGDRAKIAALINEAKLDAAKRQQMAAILQAAVGITQAALKVATVVAA